MCFMFVFVGQARRAWLDLSWPSLRGGESNEWKARPQLRLTKQSVSVCELSKSFCLTCVVCP